MAVAPALSCRHFVDGVVMLASVALIALQTIQHVCNGPTAVLHLQPLGTLVSKVKAKVKVIIPEGLAF